MGGDEVIGGAADLHAAAIAITGLADLGTDDYRDGLAVLLESYTSDAGLTPKGTRVARALLRGALTARLFSEAAWARHPEHAEVAIERPIFVTGLPRSGTTALHRLLTADPGHQGLQLWLAEVPQPRPPRETWAADPAFRYVQAGCERHHVSHPEFMAVHYMAAQASAGWSTTFRGEVIGRDQLETWAYGLDRFTEARARHDPARFYDIDYDDFVAKPMGTVEAVYHHFGLTLSGRAADAMRALCGQNSGTAAPGHHYALSDFGLTGEQVDERFAGYHRARA
jgi:hypothetical protein